MLAPYGSMCLIIHGCGLFVFLFLNGTQATTKLDVNTLSHPTIQHRCSILLAEDALPQHCKDCRENLRAQLTQQKKAVDNQTDPKVMSTSATPEMETRIKKLHDSTRTLAKKFGHLEAKINAGG